MTISLLMLYIANIFTDAKQTKSTENPNKSGGSSENPKTVDEPCKSYIIKLQEEDKEVKSKPSETEVWQHAKRYSMPLVKTVSYFATPDAPMRLKNLPDNMVKTFSSLQSNIEKTGGASPDGHKFHFMGGVVAAAVAEEDDDKSDKDKDKDKKEPEKQKDDSEKPKEDDKKETPAAALKGTKPAPALKGMGGSKLIPRSMRNLRQQP